MNTRSGENTLVQPSVARCRPRAPHPAVGESAGRSANRPRAARTVFVRAARRNRSAQRSEPVAELGGVQLRLLPGGEVPTAIDLVEVDEVGIRLLRPAP